MERDRTPGSALTRTLLLSGGLDSVALIAVSKPDNAIFIDYGQAGAAAERRAACAAAAHFELDLLQINAPLAHLAPSAVNPTDPTTNEWFPYRNQLLVTVAATALAARQSETELWLGLTADDLGVHDDCSTSFIAQLSDLLASQTGRATVAAPVQHLSGPQLQALADLDPVTISRTHSCNGGNFACARCDSCRRRQRILDAASSPKTATAPPTDEGRNE